jgi:hypothetical protein
MNTHIRGESKLGCLFLLLIAGTAIYIGFKWGDAQWNYETMKEKITESTKFLASQKRINLADVKKTIMDDAEEAGIDLYEEDVEIKVGNSYVTIDIYWETPIDLPGYTYYLEYSINNSRKKRY